jgi:hypothetical protein
MEVDALQHFQRAKTLMDILYCYHIEGKGTTILQNAQILRKKLCALDKKQ